jgi:hypothetical protein
MISTIQNPTAAESRGGAPDNAARAASAASPNRDVPPWGYSLALALFALCLLLVSIRLRPPAPEPAGTPAAGSAPAMEVSAERAQRLLDRLAGDGRPHPLGSAANAELRQRIGTTLTGLGYRTRFQEGTGCSWKGACGRVHNIVARLAGREPGAVALVSHYDSVAAGPGASDDLSGVVAVLEAARVLARGPRPRHSVVVLIDDGEEEGLLGAESFMAQSPDARDVKAVINLEARGTSGPSMMFETSGADGWLVASWARRARRPLATSIATAIYRRLPYDTDLSVFERYGVPALNFAFIGDPSRYHTPRDDVAHASSASLLHQCDNALSAVRGLAAADLGNPPGGSAAFFDVLGLGVVRWPLAWTVGLALVCLVLLLAVAVRAVRGRFVNRGDLARGLLLLPAVAAAAGAIAAAGELVLRVPGVLGANWPARPLPVLAAAWLAGFALAAAMMLVITRERRPRGTAAGPTIDPLPALPHRRVSTRQCRGAGDAPGDASSPSLRPTSCFLGTWAGVWSGWALVALVLSLAAPGSAYLFLVPALTAAVAGVLGIARVGRTGRAGRIGRVSAAIAPGVVAVLLWFPVLLPLYLALGILGLPVVFALIALLFTATAPLLPAAVRAGHRSRRAGLTPALAALTAAVVLAALVPVCTPDSPRPLNIVFHQDAASGQARWLVGGALPVPAPLSRAEPFGRPAAPFPFTPPALRAVAAPAPALAVQGPRLTLIASATLNGRRRLRLRLTSPRGAPVAGVYIPTSAGIEEARIDGRLVPPPPAGRQAPAPGWRGLADVTLAPGGCELELLLDETRPLAWYVIDMSPGLPEGGIRLEALRPPTATPVREGDLTVFTRKVVV